MTVVGFVVFRQRNVAGVVGIDDEFALLGFGAVGEDASEWFLDAAACHGSVELFEV